jgi:hypothetical protein
MPVDAWLDVVALLEAKAEEWPESLAAYDLRWHENEMRMGRRSSMPGAPFFSERWTWSRYYTRGLMRNEEAWVDSRFARPLPVHCPSIARENDDTPDSSVSDCLPIARQLPVNHHTRGGEQLNNLTTKQEEEVSSPATTAMPSAGDKKPAKAIPPDLLDAYNAYRAASGITRVSKLTATKGQGQKLYRIHEEAGADAVGLFQWLARSQDGKATFYRSGKFAAETVLRHLEDLLDLVDAKPSQTPHKGQGASANATDTPAHIFMRAYQHARGQHPAWLDHVPSDERAHFERAARHCSGFVMLREMSTHPLEKKRAVETFNLSFEATK